MQSMQKHVKVVLIKFYKLKWVWPAFKLHPSYKDVHLFNSIEIWAKMLLIGERYC